MTADEAGRESAAHGARPTAAPTSGGAGALDGVRVLDLTDLSGALCARLLGDFGADVVRVEPPHGAQVRRLGRSAGDASVDAPADGDSDAHRFFNANKRGVAIDVASSAGRERLRELVAAADVVVAGSPPDLLRAAELDRETLLRRHPRLVLVDVTPFGGSGPRASWRGSDLVCTARSGMTYVNGHPDQPPLAPFGLAAYTSAAVYGAIGALCALRARERRGRGGLVDVAIVQATAGAVEHVTGFYRQNGEVERRRGTLHWSRYFRIGRCADGWVLHTTMGDWTTLAEWVASDGEAWDLRDPRWEEPVHRKEGAEHLFDCLDAWARRHRVEDLMEQAHLRRLPYAAVRDPRRIADDEQLRARGFPATLTTEDGRTAVLPGPPVLLSASPWRFRRPAPRLGEHDDEVARDPAWRTAPTSALEPRDLGAQAAAPAKDGARVLDDVLVLDFTWVVAGPVATRILADQGARVIKIERRDATDFGNRRGGLTGNLNRGKQSVVLNLAHPRGLELARDLARRADVVIDNFSPRVMRNWGLDDEGLRALNPRVIAVSMSGFGLTGPWRDNVSYGPTLQALVGFPYLMRHPGGDPAGWGYSWSDMLGGMMGALATLVALRHRDRTGEGQLVDLGQYGNLASFLGPESLALLRGEEVAPPGNASQEGPAVPHGLYRCAPEPDGRGGVDDDRWIAIAVLADDAWRALARVLAADGETWAAARELETLAGRLAAREAIDRALERWTRTQRAADVEQRLQDAGVAAGLVANGADLAADPQLAHRGYFATVDVPGEAPATFDGVPFVSSVMPGRVSGPGPLLGEHTDLVLRDLLGIDPADIAALRAEGAIG